MSIPTKREPTLNDLIGVKRIGDMTPAEYMEAVKKATVGLKKTRKNGSVL